MKASTTLLGVSFFLVGCGPAGGPPPEEVAPGVQETAPAAALPPADIVMVNGIVLTVDNDFSTAEAVAITGDRLVAVGNDEAVEALIGPETEVIELGGRTVIPGLIDNHMHFTRGVERWHLQARIDGVNSRAAALDIIRGKAESLEPGAWMMVQGGWSEGQFADQPGGFTLDELDTAAPENPLFVQQSYFTIYANSLALEAVGLSPADGARRSAMGLAGSEPPYGELIQQIPPVTAAQREQNLTDFMAVLNRAGLTGVYALGRPPEGDIATVARRAGQGPLPSRPAVAGISTNIR